MKLLVLYHAGFTYTPAIFHYLDAFRRHSLHRVEFFNVDQAGPVDFSGYDAVLVNFCVASVARLPEPPPSFLRLVAALRGYAGLKIATVQDEYDATDRVKRFFLDTGVSAVLTNVPAGSVRVVYPEPGFGGVHFETVLTAYLADDLVGVDGLLPLAERDIPLGYRGRELPARLGDIGWHKSEIGYRFRDACNERGIACDIEVEEGARFHGDAWLGFIRRCQVMLGTESGSNVFDFDGSLQERIKALSLENPAITYADIREEIAQHEIGFGMGQVSARIFEAAASCTAMALIRGNYSGVVEPDEHYVPIEPDYSNIGQVLDRILDVPAMQAMADRAYEHVVGNPANRYSSLVDRVDCIVSNSAAPRGVPSGVRLSVTQQPLGADPYLVERLMSARRKLKRSASLVRELLDAAAAGRLAVTLAGDGDYRVNESAMAQ